MTERVASPCVSICVLDEKDVCEGCYRHADEIVDWLVFSEDEKREVLKRCEERRKASGRLLL